MILTNQRTREELELTHEEFLPSFIKNSKKRSLRLLNSKNLLKISLKTIQGEEILTTIILLPNFQN